jgi:hypothetical protein
MAALPILKLFFLGVKQLSKPVASFIKTRAKNSPTFKQHVINASQLWHRFNVRAAHAASNASAEARAVRIKPLDEATAVATFTDLLGEGVIYFVAAVALVIEYQMSAEKDAKKAAALELRFKTAEVALENQQKESEALRTELKGSQQKLINISQDVLEILQVCFTTTLLVDVEFMVFCFQGHRFSSEAIAARQARLAAYVASVDGFAEDLAIRAAVSPVAIAPHTHFSDRWSNKIRSMLGTSAAPPAAAASEHENK